MSERDWALMKDAELDLALKNSIPELPPDDIVMEVTPWRKAMNRSLAGLALTTITLNFLGLNIRKYLRFVETGKNPDFWKAPEGLEPERPRRISRTVKNGGAKKKKLQPNEAARKSYRRKGRH